MAWVKPWRPAGCCDFVLRRGRWSWPVMLEVLTFEQQERARSKASVAVGDAAQRRLSARVEVAEVGWKRRENSRRPQVHDR